MSDKQHPQSQTPGEKILQYVRARAKTTKAKIDRYMNRRPHRSFRMTKRRDHTRSLQLPGYWAFTSYVRRTLWAHKKTFISVVAMYALLTAVLVGIASQDNYTILTDTLRDTGSQVFSGNVGAVGQAGLLFLASVSGGLRTDLTEVQSVYAAIIALLVWLTTVWLLRNILAGHTVRVRDGIYNGSAPIISTFAVALVLVIQLLPLSIAIIGYTAAVATGLLDGGVEAMLFWFAAGMLGLLSLYWITSTFIALVIVTIPGMYPYTALKTAGDMVIGRRIRILLRIVWLAAGIAIGWIVVMLPVILLDTWLKGIWPAISGVPIIPVVLLLLGSLTIVWAASYIYLLYRKVVADDADPA
jgi:hypothetical protein